MPIVSGRVVHGSLARAVTELKGSERALAERMAELSGAEAALTTEAAGLFKDLADLRLDAIARGEIAGRLDAAEEAARRALAARQEEAARLQAEIDALDEAIVDAIDRREAATDRLDAAVEALAAQADATEARLAGEADWQAADAEVAAVEARAAAADAKANRAEGDRADKSQAYMADPLFSYLWERHYDTPDYRAMAIVKHVDAMVARLVGYPRARQDFHRLNEIPRRLRGHADAVEAEAEAARSRLETLERTALEADGIAPLEADAEAAEAAVGGIETEIEDTEARRAELAAGLDRLLDPGSDEGLARAHAGLVRAFELTDLRDLADEARATAAPDDDRIVRRLDAIAEERRALDRERADHRREERALADRRESLEAEQRRARRRGYDRPGAGFENGDLIGELIKGVVTGALSSGALSEALADGFRSGSRRRGSRMGSRIRLPNLGSGSRRGGGFGGSFGGGRSKGGFRTGGGF